MSFRKLQVAELLRRNLSIVFQQEGHYIYGNEPLVTVTNVVMTPDLALAKIYLSIYNTNSQEGVLVAIEHAMAEIKKNLYHRIRRHVRRVPDILFYLDETLDEAQKVDELFIRLREDNQMGSEEE